MESTAQNSVSEIVDQMLRFGRTSIYSTERFRLLRHDKDLLPQFQRQLERVLDSYGKLSPITYDTQGFRDQGVDIAIRLHDETQQYHSIIGLQIKATGDLLEKDYMQRLKSQHYDSSRLKGLQQYYIVLCVYERDNKDRIRAIEAEFKDAPRTKIIEPTFADLFLKLSQQRIDAYIRRSMAGGDVVLSKALEVVKFESRMTGAVLVYLTVRACVQSQGPVDIATVRGSGLLRVLHGHLLSQEETDDEGEDAEDVIEFLSPSEVQSDFDSQINRELEILADGPIEVNGDTITVRFDQVTPLIALATEAVVRYEYEPEAVMPYLLDLLNLSAD